MKLRAKEKKKKGNQCIVITTVTDQTSEKRK